MQIRQRRGDKFDVELATRHGAQAAHALVVDGTEEFRLEQQRQRLDLVQEQRAVQRAFHEAGLGAFGIGEGTGLEAKQFHLQQGLRNGGAVDLDERPLSTWATVVGDPCHQPLARARFPLQQERWDKGTPHRVESSEIADLIAQGLDDRRIAHDAISGMGVRDRGRPRHDSLSFHG